MGSCDPSPEAAAAVLGDAALAKTQKMCVNAGGWQVEGEQKPEAEPPHLKRGYLAEPAIYR